MNEACRIISGRYEDCPSNAFNRFIWRPDVKMLHQFLSRTIRYKSSSAAYVNDHDVCLLWKIYTGQRVNLGKIIVKQIKETKKNKKLLCGFGHVITALIFERSKAHPDWVKPYKADLIKGCFPFNKQSLIKNTKRDQLMIDCIAEVTKKHVAETPGRLERQNNEL